MRKLVIAQPGFDADTARVWESVVHSLYPNPKIDTLPNPAHTGIIFVDWRRATGVDGGETILIDSFPHGYNYTPTVFATYLFNDDSAGTLPFQVGALGMLTIDSDEKNINVKYHSIDFIFPTTPVEAFTMRLRYYVMAEHGIGT